MGGSWSYWLMVGYVSLGFWAVFYLLRKVRKLELQVRTLKHEDERLNDSIEVLYHLHGPDEEKRMERRK